jgi:hypothetical protein
MEKREEIKDGVKQRLIEFMAEQITKEDSFADLKSELIQEFLIEKKIKNNITEKTIENLSDLSAFDDIVKKNSKVNTGDKNRFDGTLFDRMAKSKEDADKFINEKTNKHGNLIKKIFDIKTGNEPVNLKKFMDTELEKDSKTYNEIIELIEGGRVKEIYAPENFTDYSLRYNYGKMTKEQKDELINTNLYLIKRSIENPINDEFHNFEVKTFSEGENIRKEYLIENKVDKFKFVCSYVYNSPTNQTYIDRLYVDSAGLLIQNEDLGTLFAIEALNIMDAAEKIRKEGFETVKEKLSDLFRPEIPEVTEIVE